VTPPPPTPLRALQQAVTVEPGATCLEAGKLVGRVARWLRRDTIDERIFVQVRGDVTRKDRVSFVIDRGGGDRAERTIEDAPEDCDQLHSALALSIALAIDANSVGAGQWKSELPEDAQLLEKPEPPQPPYFRFALGLFGHATAGLLTDTSAAVSGRIEVGFLRWLDLRLGVFATAVGRQTLRPEGATGTFDIKLIAGRSEACGVYAVGRLRMLACAGAALGSLSTRGRNFFPELSETRFWSAALGSIEAQAELWSWLALAASVDLTVPLAKHRIQAVGPQRELVGERLLTPVAVLVGAGLVVRFF
jgi:hypothetical protein